MKDIVRQRKFAILFTMLCGLIAATNLFSQGDELSSKVKYKDIDAVKELIAAGADLNRQDESTGYTALIWACEFDYTDIAKLLVSEGADVNIRAKDGTTALVRAAGNAPGVIELLISKGADIRARPEDGMGVMHQSVFGILYKGFSVESAEILLSHGAEVDEAIISPEDIEGYTPLFWAARGNNEELVKILIKHGANVNARAGNGNTPLSLAAEEGHTGMVELLKAEGAK